jgi:hypothetical protein
MYEESEVFMRAVVWPHRIDFLGARAEGGGFSWEPLLDDLKAEHVASVTPHGKRLSVVLNPQGRLDAFVYRTARMSDDEVIHILNEHGIEASVGRESEGG